MKYYSLSGTIYGKAVFFKKKFANRTDALQFMFKYYDKHHLNNLEVINTYEKVKHDVEYVCNNSNRFNITRAIA